ncbi:hypothetical protein [Flaviflagellibacter deserti]|uniref:Uncharacterized protein n=1 Tax=Flaviflagellibacter deserti TaxID=2267266 RepID=A0ABV9Z0N3_9HYPH
MFKNGEQALEQLRAIDVALSERAARFAGVFPLTVVQAETAENDGTVTADTQLDERIARFVFRRPIHT